MVDAADFLEALAERDGVRSVALYLEGDGDGARWCAALERCARTRGSASRCSRPARSRAGAAAAEAHTGAVAGDQRVFRAFVRGVRRGLGRGPARPARAGQGARRAAGRRQAALQGAPARHPCGVAVMTCSGGDSAVAADLAAELGVDLPALAPATLERSERMLPAAATAANPLDYTSLLWDEPERLQELIEALGDDPGVGRVLVLYDEPAAATRRGRRCSTPSAGGGRSQTPVVTVASTLPELLDDESRRLRDRDPAVAGLRSGLRAVGDARAGARPARIAAIAAPRRAGRDALARRARGQGAPARRRHPGRPDGRRDRRRRVAAWRELGGPVAIKRLGRDAQGARRRRRARPRRRARASATPRGVPGAAACSSSGWRRPGRSCSSRSAATASSRCSPSALGGVHTEVLDDVALVPLPAAERAIARGARALRAPIAGRSRSPARPDAAGTPRSP